MEIFESASLSNHCRNESHFGHVKATPLNKAEEIPEANTEPTICGEVTSDQN